MTINFNQVSSNNFYRNMSILVILIIAFALRFYMATRVPLIHDEEQWIGLARACTIIDGQLKLVPHGYQHPALPAYFIRVSNVLFGDGNLGYRLLNIFAGVFMIWIIYLMALRWFGVRAALWSALFLTFNEYHIGISSFAVEKSFYLCFASIALYYFYKAIDENNPKLLILSGIHAGLSFLCKEIAALLLVAFFFYILFSEKNTWLRKKELWGGLLVFAIIIWPDVYWNMKNTIPDHDGFVNYMDHFKRISRFGFNLDPFAFYFSGLFNTFLTDLGIWRNDSPEYPGPNLIWGALCFFGVIFSVYDFRHKFKKLLLFIFFVVFGVVTFLTWKPSRVFEAGLVKVEWYWCSITLVPAVLLVSDKISQVTKKNVGVYYTLIFLVIVAIGRSCVFLWGLN